MYQSVNASTAPISASTTNSTSHGGGTHASITAGSVANHANHTSRGEGRFLEWRSDDADSVPEHHVTLRTNERRPLKIVLHRLAAP